MKYTGENLKEVLFPLGGIGSGSISISGNGILKDWEIMNRPNKGSLNRRTHFAIRVIDQKGKIYTKVICGDIQKDLMGYANNYGFGLSAAYMSGFPHFKNCEMTGEFPFAVLEFSDRLESVYSA